MRRLSALVLVMTIGFAPSAADPVTASIYADHIHLVQSGMYEIMGAASASESAFEISMWAGAGEVTLSSDSAGEPFEAGGCVEIFRDNVQESGCAALQVVTDGAMQTSRVTGTMSSLVSDYVNDPETGPTFIERGPSTIHIDLTFTGTGLIRRKESHRTGLGLCGLPPDTNGASVMVETPLERDAVAVGTFASATFGAIDPAVLQPEMLEARYLDAGAKLEGCL